MKNAVLAKPTNKCLDEPSSQEAVFTVSCKQFLSLVYHSVPISPLSLAYQSQTTWRDLARSIRPCIIGYFELDWD